MMPLQVCAKSNFEYNIKVCQGLRKHFLNTLLKRYFNSVKTMVFIIDSFLEIGKNVTSNLYYLICLRHLIRLKAVTDRTFFLRRPIFLHASRLSYHLVEVT